MAEIFLAAGAVIRDPQGRVLLGRHRPERGGPWSGRWICPGGRLRPGETLRDAARREVREETRLDVRLGKHTITFDSVLEGGAVHAIYVVFAATVVTGEARAESDLGEVRWFSREDLRRDGDALHPDTARLLAAADLL